MKPPLHTPLSQAAMAAMNASSSLGIARTPLIGAIGFMSSLGFAETLPNGIELPALWPPLRSAADVASMEPMPVPYLKLPPETVRVHAGRQLFVDDFLIAENSLTRTFHQPVYHPQCPVFQPETALEKTHAAAAAPFSDGVWYDSRESLFKMWYRAGSDHTCLAVSKDGVHWDRPELPLLPGTNAVLKGARDAATVWLDHEAKNPEERFKMAVARTRKSPYHLAMRVSADGRSWSDERAVSGPSWDRSTIFWNPFRRVWVASVRGHDTLPPQPTHRLRNYHEGTTLESALAWTLNTDKVSSGAILAGDLQPWTAADKLDPRHPDPAYASITPQLYNLDAFPYESLLVGLFTIWQGPDNESCKKLNIHKRNEVFTGFSRDGFHWDRPDRSRFLPVGTSTRDWNAGNVQSVGGGCLVVGDQLYFYCSGRTKEPIDSTSTGLAILRRDGFASLDAGAASGSVTTRALQFSGGHLFVNAAVSGGELRAEVLDLQGKTIPGFTAEESEPVSTDSTKVEMQWRGRPDLSRLSEGAIRLRFHMRQGSLYAFWLTADARGASGGYVAAGGPDFENGVDATPVRPQQKQP